MVKYTIAVCNYNMADTIEKSLKSMLEQVGNKKDFEILVVDDGSTDGSLEIIKDLEEEYNNLRHVNGNNNNLGEARNQSFQEAKGKYILEQMDTDDIYHKGVLDFVEVGRQLHEKLDFEFHLEGASINMSRKELFLKYPHKSMGRWEDQEFQRRLIYNDSFLRLEHEPFWEPIGYDNFHQRAKNFLGGRIFQFQAKTYFWDILKFALKEKPFLGFPSQTGFLSYLTICPIAYLIAQTKEKYDVPSKELRKTTYIAKEKEKRTKTVKEIEDEYNIKIDRDGLSERGKEIFYLD